MKVLALDCAFGAISLAAAAWQDGELSSIGVLTIPRPQATAERLVPLISDALSRADILPHELSLVAVTSGPGTFTGVRAGIAVANGLALATGCEVAAATTFAVVAAGARNRLGLAAAGRPVAVAFDARLGQVFLQCFGADGRELGPGRLVDVAEAAAAIAGLESPIVAGSGSALVMPAPAPGVTVLDLAPDARDLLALVPRLARGRRAAPIYLRAPDAKPQAHKTLPHA